MLFSCAASLDIVVQYHGGINYWRELIPVAACYSHLFHAVVSVMAAARATLSRDPEHSKCTEIDHAILLHKGLALSKLRTFLLSRDTRIDEGVILTMVLLCVSPFILTTTTCRFLHWSESLAEGAIEHFFSSKMHRAHEDLDSRTSKRQ